MMNTKRPFLTAEWRYLLMLQYVVDPQVLAPLLPAGTTLDLWQGAALVSMVGFDFRKTRLLGLPVPFHTRFEEVNLRYYVQAGQGEDARRGVAFVKEIVPRPWVARVARWVYGEPYIAAPMQHTIEERGGSMVANGLVEYTWRMPGSRSGRKSLNRLGGLASGDLRDIQPGTEEAFIFEREWGFTRRGRERTGAYRVIHPPWQVWNVTQPYLLCDVERLYGSAFAPFLRRPPHSAFLALGSAVTVMPGTMVNSQHGRHAPDRAVSSK
jgi:uncharacterized protein YqjF (DUF2071 family)